MPAPDFFDIPEKDLPEGVLVDTYRIVRGWKIRRVVREIKMKRKTKIEERFYCHSKSLPKYITSKAYKSIDNLMAMISYYINTHY